MWHLVVECGTCKRPSVEERIHSIAAGTQGDDWYGLDSNDLPDIWGPTQSQDEIEDPVEAGVSGHAGRWPYLQELHHDANGVMWLPNDSFPVPTHGILLSVPEGVDEAEWKQQVLTIEQASKSVPLTSGPFDGLGDDVVRYAGSSELGASLTSTWARKEEVWGLLAPIRENMGSQGESLPLLPRKWNPSGNHSSPEEEGL